MVDKVTYGIRETYQYVRTNYRLTGGHIDYGNVQGFLISPTLTFSTDANGEYYTHFNKLFSGQLGVTGPTAPVLVSCIIGGVNYLHGNRCSSVWGSADNGQSAATVCTVFFSYSAADVAGNESHVIVFGIQHQPTASALAAVGNAWEPNCVQVFLFVVSR